MNGFLENVPVLAKVTWTDAEVPLLLGEPTPYGLLAEVNSGGQRQRYFVPWDKVTYLRQDIPASVAEQAPQALRPSPSPSSPRGE